MPDSNHGSPRPSDEKPKQPDEGRVEFSDNESVDLGKPEPGEESASAALSLSGSSSVRKGATSSVIRSWEQLVRETEGDSGNYGKAPTPNVVEAESDHDLLKELLTDEPSPSAIIMKDPSGVDLPTLPEVPISISDPENALEGAIGISMSESGSGSDLRALSESGRSVKPTERAPAEASDSPSSSKLSALSGSQSDLFQIPTDLSAASNSSVLGGMPDVGADQSGFTSDVWGSSSRVDLSQPGVLPEPIGFSSGSLQSTDEVAQPVSKPKSEESSNSWLNDALSESAESSAVDLGKQAVNLPFPLGADSSLGSSIIGKSSSSIQQPSSKPDSDSGMVDLLASSDEFGLSQPESTTSPSWASAREDLPPTVPMVPAGRSKMMTIAGSGAGGLLLGVATCAGLWFAGVVPNKSTQSPAASVAASPTPVPTQPVNDAALVEARNREAALAAQLKEAIGQRDQQAAKATASGAAAKKAASDLDALNAQLKQAGLDPTALAGVADALTNAKSAAEQMKQMRAKADAAAAKAQATQTELNASIQTLTAAAAASEAKARDANARIAAMTEQHAATDAELARIRKQYERTEAARAQAADFMAGVARRLHENPGASTADLLSALDRSLDRASTATVAKAEYPPIYTQQQARHAAQAAFAAMRVNDPARAEQEFGRLAHSSDGNAVYFYFLGLSQWQLGRTADAEKSFRRGWSLERDSQPPPAEVEAAFERLGHADRSLVNRFRQ